MKISHRRTSLETCFRGFFAVLCSVLLGFGEAALLAQQPPAPAAADTAEKLPPEALDALVAPVALYPDELLAQTLVASTYPLELMQLQQWLAKNKGLKDKALSDAVARQPWDPAIQSMAAFPDVVKRLADDIQWTTDLGNAFLDQQGDVMDAAQRMRKKAQDKGALKSNEQQKVEVKVVEEKQVIVVQSASPEVIYVPSYSPAVVYGPPPPLYAYPPIYYPPYPPGAAFVSFTAGVMIGAAFWGGSCCHCGWGGGYNNHVNINVNNNFNRNTNINTGNRGGGNANWSHNPQHRGGAPYANKATANKYGGSARGDAASSRQASARQQGAADRSAGGAGNRGGSPSAGNRAAGSGADRIGSRDVGSGAGSKGGGFGGGSGGMSGRSASAASSRGASSMGSRGGGGGGRGGGGRRR